jgi:membrane fusion protein, copper/silver efflux system
MMNPQGVQAPADHQHGERAPGDGTPAGTPPSPVPEALASQLPRLAEAYETLKATLQRKDLEKSRQAYKVFYNVLCAVDPSSLKDRSALVWKEATMLLRNDSMLGGEADTQEEAARLFQTLTDHYQVLKEHFHVERILQAQAVSASVPAEFKKGMGRLVQDYLAIQNSLAGDDFPSAKKAGEKFATTLNGMDMGLLKGEAHGLWMDALDMLKKGSEKIAAARDIEALRSGFEFLSIGTAGSVERLGADIKGPIFELFCPMAFNNKGATWLQQDEEVRNPYFGAAMFACGEVRRQLKKDRS